MTPHFTCGESKIWLNFPENIMSMVVGDNRFSIKPLNKPYQKIQVNL